MNLSVSVIIVNYNVKDYLANCLNSIQNSNYGGHVEIIVIDNSSYDGSAAMVRERFPAVRLIENADLAIGSRYISGINVVNWPLQRLIISYGANIYTRLITRLPVRDATGGFKCWRREALEAINLDGVRSQGYSFQIEMTYRAWLKGFRITEIPIIFVDRTVGESKMTRSIMLEAAVMIPRLRIWKLFGWHK